MRLLIIHDNHCRHWLYRSCHEGDSDIIKNSVIRISAILDDPDNDTETLRPLDTFSIASTPESCVFRTLSRTTSRQTNNPLSPSTITNVLFEAPPPWNQPHLSTEHTLISPRHLGPTHILVIHDIPKTVRSASNVVECPINDLLFVLNCPNLANESILPRRLPKELPRVALNVTHTDTFPELIVYLHTRNQAELFRKILPQWIRDLLHPLPPSLTEASSTRTIRVSGVPHKRSKFLGLGKRKRSWFLTCSRSECFPSAASSPSSSSSSLATLPSSTARTIDTIAKEVAEADDSVQQRPHNGVNLHNSLARLNALKDNLGDIGFYGREIWQELNTTHCILTRAVNIQARLAKQELEEDEQVTLGRVSSAI